MCSEQWCPQFPAEVITEGRVRVLVPRLEAFVERPSDYAPSKAPVFFNPVMELNRDVAVLALQAYQRMVDRGITVCEPLTGCGLRGIRFAVEVENTDGVVISDINKKAFTLAKYNVQLNNVAGKVEVRNDEANLVLACHGAPRRRFDAVDVDPFGSPVPFLDSTVRALRNNGLLALTATDMASLCGVHQKACFRRYGGRPLRTEYCHELAVRLLAGCLVKAAAKYDLGVDIVFSHRGEHYVRVYATVKHGAVAADEGVEALGFVLHCFKCFHRETVHGLRCDRSTCRVCGSTLGIAGPLWLGHISDVGFCERMKDELERKKLKYASRIGEMLGRVKAESCGPATYFVVDSMCDAYGLPVPPVRSVIEVLRGEGFHAVRTHFHPRGIRSDVPARGLVQILGELTNTRVNSD